METLLLDTLPIIENIPQTSISSMTYAYTIIKNYQEMFYTDIKIDLAVNYPLQ